MHLADLTAYVETQGQVGALYADPDAWARKAILNVAGSGKFSSDRTIAQYAERDLEGEAVSGGVGPGAIMSEPLPTVYLARHGETAWTVSKQHTGRTDLPLTERGERNARASPAGSRG